MRFEAVGFSMNQKFRVALTDEGLRRWEQVASMEDISANNARNSGVVEVEMWKLFNVFGPGIAMDTPVYFKGNRIEPVQDLVTVAKTTCECGDDCPCKSKDDGPVENPVDLPHANMTEVELVGEDGIPGIARMEKLIASPNGDRQNYLLMKIDRPVVPGRKTFIETYSGKKRTCSLKIRLKTKGGSSMTINIVRADVHLAEIGTLDINSNEPIMERITIEPKQVEYLGWLDHASGDDEVSPT